MKRTSEKLTSSDEKVAQASARGKEIRRSMRGGGPSDNFLDTVGVAFNGGATDRAGSLSGIAKVPQGAVLMKKVMTGKFYQCVAPNKRR